MDNLVASTLQGGGQRGHRIDAEGAAGGHLVVPPEFYEPHRPTEHDARPSMDISPALTAHHKRDGGQDEAMVLAGALGVTSLTGLDDKSAQGHHLVAAPLTRGSSRGEGVNEPGRRQEDDVNLVTVDDDTVSFHLTQDPISNTNGATPAMSKGNQEGCATIAVASHVGVRRLTPTECERLMSWPDGHTAPPGLKSPDSRRYAACGDGVVSNVAEFIGRRMLAVHAANLGRTG